MRLIGRYLGIMHVYIFFLLRTAYCVLRISPPCPHFPSTVTKRSRPTFCAELLSPGQANQVRNQADAIATDAIAIAVQGSVRRAAPCSVLAVPVPRSASAAFLCCFCFCFCFHASKQTIKQSIKPFDLI
ncbi:uncharacterized protein K452DRAFT_77465 [Aplosporella prunicola CBS 121167]|uniref:Uncharacterized protein n=1 Tax=Aplosporella prunicola CBS 121167 TaxID=1176127 RepID=A0A6A6BAB1_9PEZI|nr:uncharacterized protein K452DRAFT_77465 [Aplosporella prunicola CBS 121167]KAF2139441.1 hypothetical protein K452DRAFT_77465 [Aplosporella prunicola CBS 121167]